MKRKVSRKKNKSRRKRIYTKKGGNTNIILETINNSKILYNIAVYNYVEIYYKYCIEIFKIVLNNSNLKLNIVFRFSQAQEIMENSKKFGNSLNKLDADNKTIYVDINHEHTIVKDGVRENLKNAPLSIAPYIYNSNKKYRVSIHKHEELQKSNIIIDYSNINIENLKQINAFPEYVNKLIYISPAFYNLYTNKENRSIDCLTTFMNVDVERRKKLIENIKQENVNNVNVNNIFNKDELQELYKKTKVHINIHQDVNINTFQELRVLPALLCGTIVISEESPLKETIPYTNSIIWCSYDNIPKKVKEVLDNYDTYYNNIFSQDNIKILSDLHNQNIFSLQNKLNSLK